MEVAGPHRPTARRATTRSRLLSASPEAGRASAGGVTRAPRATHPALARPHAIRLHGPARFSRARTPFRDVVRGRRLAKVRGPRNAAAGWPDALKGVKGSAAAVTKLLIDSWSVAMELGTIAYPTAHWRHECANRAVASLGSAICNLTGRSPPMRSIPHRALHSALKNTT
jgi:hypothetical protein